jgi:hypothetical protein
MPQFGGIQGLQVGWCFRAQMVQGHIEESEVKLSEIEETSINIFGLHHTIDQISRDRFLC